MPALNEVVLNDKALILSVTYHSLTRFTKALACADPMLEGSFGAASNFSIFSPVTTTTTNRRY